MLRVPPDNGGPAGGKDAVNMRDSRGKAKQFTTANGRTVVIKDNFVYSNKGFKTLNQAQLLYDVLWYPDSLEPRPWLIYYISRPLVGLYAEDKIVPAVIGTRGPRSGAPTTATIIDAAGGVNVLPLPKKININTFSELLNHFPIIARQMLPGLERLFKEFHGVFDKPLPPPPSAPEIPDPTPEGPISVAVKHARNNSMAEPVFVPGRPGDLERMDSHIFDDDEDVMRNALETAVTAAIDLFQMVDKQQLSLLGATTDLTGPVVERLIERYVAEQLHDSVLYPKLCALKKLEDMELELRIKQMQFVDVAQVGIPIQGGRRAKQELTLRIQRAVEEFKKLGVAGCPQQMMDILLVTLKTVTQIAETTEKKMGNQQSEKASAVLTINADTLVSLLLIVVIRAGVRHLQARLLYMRHFIFIDDVESGEMGYALSTLEAVLSYLTRDSIGLRKASRRNKKLWEATIKGDIHEMMKIMEPEKANSPDDTDEHDQEDEYNKTTWNFMNGTSGPSSAALSETGMSQASTLKHVFPWQAEYDEEQREHLEEEAHKPPLRRLKRVTMDTRSMSSSSEISFRSRATTIDSMGSGIEGDTSIVRLSQTEDRSGDSILMMAVQNGRVNSLNYLLSLQSYYPLDVVLEDTNNNGTTLLSAAVQLGQRVTIEMLLDFILRAESDSTIVEYLSRQDDRGRSVAHYLFNAHELILRLGRLLPWRQKDKNGQTPLFALCRSYDHSHYQDMVETALIAATTAQGDGEPLHLDDHVDSKGNTLLHIVNEPRVATRILFYCDSDVNATNDKKFTALMVASKYGRIDMVRALFSDQRVDLYAKELRNLTAVELAKDDEVRNRIDDLILFSSPSGDDGRITAVVRSFFVEDATIRLVLKSGAPNSNQSFTVTTCRRSLADFELLDRLLAMENPSSWLPSISGYRSPFQIPSKPSRALLRDIQLRLDAFLRVLLSHSTFATHELLWEFFLVPDIQADMMEQRSTLKAELHREKIHDEFEPVEDVHEVEQFIDHARDMVRGVNYATKSVIRRTNALKLATTDLHDAAQLASAAFSTLRFLPQTHVDGMTSYFYALKPTSNPPPQNFHTQLLSMHSTLLALLLALSRPTAQIAHITTVTKLLARDYASLGRSSRWPLGLLDDTRQRMDREKSDKLRQGEEEKRELGKELRASMTVVAGELAGWQEWRVQASRRAVRQFVAQSVVRERERLEGMRRALRRARMSADYMAGSVVGIGVVERGDGVLATGLGEGRNRQPAPWNEL